MMPGAAFDHEQGSYVVACFIMDDQERMSHVMDDMAATCIAGYAGGGT